MSTAAHKEGVRRKKYLIQKDVERNGLVYKLFTKSKMR
jgi:hypothetical protein